MLQSPTSETKPSKKCAKKGKKNNKGDGKKLNRLFNLVDKNKDGEATASAEAESTIEDTEIVEATNGRKKANRFYLSKIQAVEKLLIGMRKKKKKGQQSQEHRFVCLFVCAGLVMGRPQICINWSPRGWQNLYRHQEGKTNNPDSLSRPVQSYKDLSGVKAEFKSVSLHQYFEFCNTLRHWLAQRFQNKIEEEHF